MQHLSLGHGGFSLPMIFQRRARLELDVRSGVTCSPPYLSRACAWAHQEVTPCLRHLCLSNGAGARGKAAPWHHGVFILDFLTPTLPACYPCVRQSLWLYEREHSWARLMSSFLLSPLRSNEEWVDRDSQMGV
jgi:hypothetical protein